MGEPNMTPDHRGFMQYDNLVCSYGTTVSMKQSSTAFVDRLWLGLDQDPEILKDGRPGGAVAHLTWDNAVALRDQLTHWIDEHHSDEWYEEHDSYAEEDTYLENEKAFVNAWIECWWGTPPADYCPRCGSKNRADHFPIDPPNDWVWCYDEWHEDPFPVGSRVVNRTHGQSPLYGVVIQYKHDVVICKMDPPNDSINFGWMAESLELVDD